MKRNLIPLFGIAVVVAIAATGVFYGLFVGKIGAAPVARAQAGHVVVVSRAVGRGTVLAASDLRLEPAGAEQPEGAITEVALVVGRTAAKPLAANETVTAAGLAGKGGEAELKIAPGMRAISVRVADSVGLMPYVRPGSRIDVQAVQAGPAGEPVARTLLSGVEVLQVHVDTSPQPQAVTVLNLLVPAADVERVALADSTAKVRIVLRNGEDKSAAPAAVPAARPAAGTAAVLPRVRFQVRVAAAAAETVREMAAQAGVAGGAAMRIGALPAGWRVEEALGKLERENGLRLLATENLDSAQWQEVTLAAGAEKRGDYELRLRLMPWEAGKGTLRVRVRPELSYAERGGVSSRRSSAEVNVGEGQSMLVAGFERDAAAPALGSKLFPAAPSGSELLFVVTPRIAAR